ncbi:ICP22 family protein [Streptomyces humidus]|uniref:hypothetical protein n=1 Tax=Streptomyces humidus TaxID=52259 RepID=UPI00332B1608
MTPWQWAWCGTRAATTVLAGVLVLSYGGAASYAAGSAHGRVPVSAQAPAPATPSPSPREPDRAGSRAGEGRERPGREDEGEDGTAQEPGGEDVPGEDPDSGDGEAEAGDGEHADDGASRPPESPVPVTSTEPQDSVGQAATQGERADGPVLQILPLGSGLVLIGLGIALAIAALRLRRG